MPSTRKSKSNQPADDSHRSVDNDISGLISEPEEFVDNFGHLNGYPSPNSLSIFQVPQSVLPLLNETVYLDMVLWNGYHILERLCNEVLQMQFVQTEARAKSRKISKIARVLRICEKVSLKRAVVARKCHSRVADLCRRTMEDELDEYVRNVANFETSQTHESDPAVAVTRQVATISRDTSPNGVTQAQVPLLTSSIVVEPQIPQHISRKQSAAAESTSTSTSRTQRIKKAERSNRAAATTETPKASSPKISASTQQLSSKRQVTAQHTDKPSSQSTSNEPTLLVQPTSAQKEADIAKPQSVPQCERSMRSTRRSTKEFTSLTVSTRSAESSKQRSHTAEISSKPSSQAPDKKSVTSSTSSKVAKTKGTGSKPQISAALYTASASKRRRANSGSNITIDKRITRSSDRTGKPVVKSLVQQSSDSKRRRTEQLRKEHVSRRSQMQQQSEEAERLYCKCRQVSYGDMIQCDNSKCEYGWFHFECVGITTAPAGQWFCETCSKTKRTPVAKQTDSRRKT